MTAPTFPLTDQLACVRREPLMVEVDGCGVEVCDSNGEPVFVDGSSHEDPEAAAEQMRDVIAADIEGEA